MDPQLYEQINSRMDRQDECLDRIEKSQTHLNNLVVPTMNSIAWLKWIVGGTWAALLALFADSHR